MWQGLFGTGVVDVYMYSIMYMYVGVYFTYHTYVNRPCYNCSPPVLCLSGCHNSVWGTLHMYAGIIGTLHVHTRRSNCCEKVKPNLPFLI